MTAPRITRRRGLLLLKDGRGVGEEFKRADMPALAPSMRIALQDLVLDALYVVYPGTRRYALAAGVEAVPLAALLPGHAGPDLAPGMA